MSAHAHVHVCVHVFTPLYIGCLPRMSTQASWCESHAFLRILPSCYVCRSRWTISAQVVHADLGSSLRIACVRVQAARELRRTLLMGLLVPSGDSHVRLCLQQSSEDRPGRPTCRRADIHVAQTEGRSDSWGCFSPALCLAFRRERIFVLHR